MVLAGGVEVCTHPSTENDALVITSGHLSKHMQMTPFSSDVPLSNTACASNSEVSFWRKLEVVKVGFEQQELRRHTFERGQRATMTWPTLMIQMRLGRSPSTTRSSASAEARPTELVGAGARIAYE